MTTNEINKRLHEALGKTECWHEPTVRAGILQCVKCGYAGLISNLDYCYCADPRLVIEAMRERAWFGEFLDYIGGNGDNLASAEVIPIDLIMDKTGRLALLAIEWLKGHKS